MIRKLTKRVRERSRNNEGLSAVEIPDEEGDVGVESQSPEEGVGDMKGDAAVDGEEIRTEEVKALVEIQNTREDGCEMTEGTVEFCNGHTRP